MSTLVKSPTCSIVPTKLSPITTPPPDGRLLILSSLTLPTLHLYLWHTLTLSTILQLYHWHKLCPVPSVHLFNYSAQSCPSRCGWQRQPIGRAVVTNNNKERDATTWLGTIVWISLGPRKQLLGSKWHKSECATSTLVNFYHYNTTNIRRPHKCKRATNTSPVDTSTTTREPLWDNMTTRVVTHLLGVSSQSTTPGNNIWDSTGPWSKLTTDPLNALFFFVNLWTYRTFPLPCQKKTKYQFPQMEKDKSWRCWNHKRDGNKRKLSGS